MIPRMSREEFFNAIVEQVHTQLPEEYQAANVRIEKVLKDGDQLWTGLIVQLPGETNYPRIYIDQEFSQYLAGKEFHDVLKDVAKQRLEAAPPENLIGRAKEITSDPDTMRGLLTYRLVNAENNQTILEGRPHTDMGEMALIYQVEMGQGARIPVDFKLQEKLGLSTEEMLQVAEKNSPELLPVKIQTVGEALGFPGNHPEDMLVVSNAELSDGATAIFYPGVAETLRDRLEGDFLVLPSSVHEVLVIPEQNNRDLEGLEAMVRSINKMGVLPQDKLADHVLKLSRDGRSLVPAERVQPVKNVHRSQEAR